MIKDKEFLRRLYEEWGNQYNAAAVENDPIGSRTLRQTLGDSVGLLNTTWELIEKDPVAAKLILSKAIDQVVAVKDRL